MSDLNDLAKKSMEYGIHCAVGYLATDLTSDEVRACRQIGIDGTAARQELVEKIAQSAHFHLIAKVIDA